MHIISICIYAYERVILFMKETCCLELTASSCSTSMMSLSAASTYVVGIRTCDSTRVVLASIHSSASALIKMIWYTTHPWYA